MVMTSLGSCWLDDIESWWVICGLLEVSTLLKPQLPMVTLTTPLLLATPPGAPPLLLLLLLLGLNGPFDEESPVTTTEGVRTRFGLKIAGISPSRVILSLKILTDVHSVHSLQR